MKNFYRPFQKEVMDQIKSRIPGFFLQTMPNTAHKHPQILFLFTATLNRA